MKSKLIVVCETVRQEDDYDKIDCTAIEDVIKGRTHVYYELPLPIDASELIPYLTDCPCGEHTLVYQLDFDDDYDGEAE